MKGIQVRIFQSGLFALALGLCLTWPAMAQQADNSATTKEPHQDGNVPLVLGTGTTNFIPVWTSRHTIGNSVLSQNGNGVSVAGTMSAVGFTGDGSALTNVNANLLSGLSASAFAQTSASNTFTGNQTITGNLNLTGTMNNALTLQGNLTDSLGEEGANIIGGFAGDSTTGFSGNSIAAGVIGATIAGGGGAYDSGSLPPHGASKSGRKLFLKRPLRPGVPAELSSAEMEAPPAETESAPPPTGIVSGNNVITGVSNWGTIGGGLKNTALGFASTVSGGYGNTTSGNYTTVGGGNGNTASADDATVAGGDGNTASGIQSTVGGGSQNMAIGLNATVAGGGTSPFEGSANQATCEGDTVGGGEGNTAGGVCANSNGTYPSNTIAGGDGNLATGGFDTVGGGSSNSATGEFSAVPGGQNNHANGFGSFAAGSNATANGEGSFVWSGFNAISSYAQDTGPSQFVASAFGGFYFYTGSSSGVTLASGSGSWSSISDRNVKDNFAIIDGASLLEKIAALPISTWNYKTQATSIRHMGPMAQDFRAAFGLGEDDKHISNIDSEGVALAAVQALYKLNREKDNKIAELSQALDQLGAEVEKLKELAAATR